jgi:curved DNA-binding protein CbpA
MNATKDYYATLGVLPSAEDIVIRAAYKALAQRYLIQIDFLLDQKNK